MVGKTFREMPGLVQAPSGTDASEGMDMLGSLQD